MVTIRLPEESTLARDLVLTSLLSFNVDFEISGDEVKIENVEEFKDKLKDAVEYLRNDKDLSRIIKGFSRNYKKAVDLLVNERDVVSAFFSKDENEEYYLPLVFPEFMEAERWFGGWNGSSKNKKSFSISPQSLLLSVISMVLHRIVSYYRDNEYYMYIAPVDRIVMSQACKPINKRSIKVSANSLKDLSQIGKLFLFSMELRDNECQKIVLLKSSSHRVEILEEFSYSILKPFLDFWNFVKEDFEKQFIELLNKDPDAFNRVSNYVLEGINGVLSPSEASVMIARETYLKSEDLSMITPYVIKKIREALEKLSIKEVFLSEY